MVFHPLDCNIPGHKSLSVTIFTDFSHPSIEEYFMDCPSCAELLAAYEHGVSLYTTSVSEIRRLDRDDFRVAYLETKSARQVCGERHKAWMARGALIEHWHQDHDGFVGKTIPEYELWLVSQRAEQLLGECRDADNAFMEHWQQHHKALAAKAASAG